MSAALACEALDWGPATVIPVPPRRRMARRRAETIEPWCERCEVVDLADIVERAVEFSREAARRCDVRLQCYCLDQLPVCGSEPALLDQIAAMLADAVSNAVWGSRVACEAEAKDGRAWLRIWFARPASNPGSNDWAIEDGEMLSSWTIAPSHS